MKKLFYLTLMAVLFTVLYAQDGGAQTIYVNSLTGNDATGNGTSGSPYKTFNKGYTIAASGNTLNLTGTFTWTDADETGDAATTGYTIGKNLTITGQGPGVTIIQAATTENIADRRVFTINYSGLTVTIQNLTIRNGKTGASQGGGGIKIGTVNPCATSNLNLTNCIIEKNYQTETYYTYGGGALSAILNTGIVVVDKCTFQNNYSANFGGAIYTSHYAANYDNGTGYVEVKNSTICNNTGLNGTALGTYCGFFKVSNSTISNNTGGDAIYMGNWSYAYDKLYLTNVTLAYNSVGSGGYGLETSGTNTSIKNTIIAQNKRTNNSQNDYSRSSGTINNNGYNIIETQSGSDFTNGVNGCIVGVQANLRLSNTLGYNNTSYGTQTLALYGGSIAIEAGNSSANGSESVPINDQRGKSRLGSYDIGAFEYNACIWKGTTSTNFGTASNWNENVVPADGSDIAFDASASNDCVLDIDRNIGSIYNAHSTYKLVLNSKSLTIQGDISLSGSAQFDASTGNIVLSGGPYSHTITPSSSSLSVNNLNINDSKGVSLAGNLTVLNTLTLTNGLLSLGAFNLTLGSSAMVNGTPSATNMIVPTSTGELRKVFTGTASFTYPIGDNTGTVEYSPITLNFTSGTFSSAYAGITLGNSKYSNNTSVTDYLNRYWTVNQSGISSFTCDVTAQYLTSDIVGTEANIWTGKYSSSTWVLLNQADAVNHLLTGTVSGFSTFTGGQQGVMPAELSSFNSLISGRDVKLQWVTTTETNNSGFEIQKSDLSNQIIEWKNIGFVKGNGSKATPTNYSITDVKLNIGKYKYRLKQIDNNGNFAYHNLNNIVEITTPAKYSLSQNYPNPFNPKTKIDFQIPNDAKVTIKIYDLTGREVAILLNNENKKANYYSIDFDASNLSSGVYFYKISTRDFIESKKMLVIK